MALLRKFLHLEEYLRPIHFENLGKLLLTMSLLWFYFTFAERLTAWYGNSPPEMAVFWESIRKQFAPLFWTMVVCNFIIPVPILAIKRLRTITGTAIASCTVVVGMWLERFLIVVPSLEHKFLPYSWGTYRPTWVEDTLMASSFGMMAAALPAVLEIRAHDFHLGTEGRAAAALQGSNIPQGRSQASWLGNAGPLPTDVAE